MSSNNVSIIMKGICYTAFVISIAAYAIALKNPNVLGWYFLLCFLDID